MKTVFRWVGALALCALLMGASCPAPDNACETEAGVLSVVSTGIEAAEAQFSGVNNNGVTSAVTSSRAALRAGELAVSACENARDDVSWQRWVGDMLGHSLSLGQAIVGAVRDDSNVASECDDSACLPDELRAAISVLEAEHERSP